MTGRRKVAVLVSGRGSNLASLISAAQAHDYPAEIALVVSSRSDAGGLKLAQAAGMPSTTIEHPGASGRAGFETRLSQALGEAEAELVCLAGFMRLLSPAFVEDWRDRLLNIHPSLLPLFPGLDTHARALAAGVKVHGATVHFVRAEVDAGPIIAQEAVPVADGDTPQTLAARVLRAEHRLYPEALKLVASGAARVTGERVAIEGVATSESAFRPPMA